MEFRAFSRPTSWYEQFRAAKNLRDRFHIISIYRYELTFLMNKWNILYVVEYIALVFYILCTFLDHFYWSSSRLFRGHLSSIFWDIIIFMNETFNQNHYACFEENASLEINTSVIFLNAVNRPGATGVFRHDHTAFRNILWHVDCLQLGSTLSVHIRSWEEFSIRQLFD
jgi:hypothetical protein